MAHDLQTANIWKRISAWLFDSILTGILAVAFGLILSALLGYDSYSAAMEDGYARYEAQYGVTFEISLEEYEAMTAEERANYDAA